MGGERSSTTLEGEAGVVSFTKSFHNLFFAVPTFPDRSEILLSELDFLYLFLMVLHRQLFVVHL